MRLFAILLLLLTMALPAAPMAQDAPTPAPAADRSATGGAMTREDIMRRQRGEEVPTRERDSAAGAAAAIAGQLGSRGAKSDSEIWEKLRFGTADVTASNNSPASTILIQDTGMAWYDFRSGPLRTYGGYLLLGTIGLLALFFLIRGRIRIDKGRSGIMIPRFDLLERLAHWVLAVSFILLGVTGLLLLFGRFGLIDLIGKEAFSLIAIGSKWVHNWIAWPFMVALGLVFLLWVLRNIPNRHDLVWLLKGGGIITKSHPPAKKFNAGQKIVFWGVIILGASVSASGLSLLMPFEMPLFAKTFQAVNTVGVMGWFGYEALPEQLAPHTEMQLAQLWHAIVAFVMMALILAHIYIGTLGMEGAISAMGSGDVDLHWAEEHHNLWVEELRQEGRLPAQAPPAVTPAE